MIEKPLPLRSLVEKFMDNQDRILDRITQPENKFLSTNTKINISIGLLVSMFFVFGGYMLTAGREYNELKNTAMQANARSIKLEQDMREQQQKVAVIEQVQQGLNKGLESIEAKLDKLIERELSKH